MSMKLYHLLYNRIFCHARGVALGMEMPVRLSVCWSTTLIQIGIYPQYVSPEDVS